MNVCFAIRVSDELKQYIGINRKMYNSQVFENHCVVVRLVVISNKSINCIANENKIDFSCASFSFCQGLDD